MPTVGDARMWAAEELRRAGVESPVLTSDLLLAFLLDYDRVRVLTSTKEILPDEIWSRFQALVHRRACGEPLQYLTGTREFYGLDFRVTPEVLIPRPETELLVEKAINLMKAWPPPGPRFVDVGTGSGCIAVTVARHVPAAVGWALDISPGALEIAGANARRHGVESRVHLVQADLLSCFLPVPCFDLILCNPPYIALDDCDSLPSVVRDFEPHRALFGGRSGLEIYERLIPEAAPRLVSGGYILLELGFGQVSEVSRLVENSGIQVETVMDDLQGIPRCLVGRKSAGVQNGQDSHNRGRSTFGTD